VLRGQITVLLGRNGAGKTTTLRTIMGLLPAREGSILLDGQELRGRPAHAVARRGMGYVPEDREVFAALSVEENLRLARRPGAAGRDIQDIYTLFPDLGAARRRSGAALSGGQQQMLAIGRALINRNQVVLVDEPTKGLAPVIVQQLIEILRAARADGETILLVEQNLAFARALGDRYVLLDEGRAVRSGPMEELDGENDLVRRYIGV
jgi:branched-chain amino acid transport system ATP-binding protein